jgi:hypothetical protein
MPKAFEVKKAAAEGSSSPSPKASPKKDDLPPTPEAPPTPRVFAPQTMAQSRKGWTPPRPGTFARIPLWALIAGAVSVVTLIVVVVIISKYATKGKTAQTQEVAETDGMSGLPGSRTTGRSGNAGGGSRLGRIHKAGEVTRTLGQYYIVVYTTPTNNAKPEDKVAQKHAEFLADHGIDCSIETVLTRGQMWYWVVTVQGLPDATAARAQLNQIKEIGDKMKRGVWNGAFPANNLSSQGSESPVR